MSYQAKQIFVNLSVKDLKRSIAFFKEVGFEFEPNFTNDDAGCLVIGENIFAMLLNESYFQSFTKKEIVDGSRSAQVIMAISADSRAQVDEVADRALAAGAKPANEPADHGFMYSRSFIDPDDHMWEVVYMDAGAVPAE